MVHFQQGTIGQHCVEPKISFTNEIFGSNLYLSDKIVDSHICDCEDECLRDRCRLVSIRFVLHFEHVAFVFCRDPSTFVFERLLSCVKITLTVNRVFSKTCLEVFIQVL